jgi:hypothetical protein
LGIVCSAGGVDRHRLILGIQQFPGYLFTDVVVTSNGEVEIEFSISAVFVDVTVIEVTIVSEVIADASKMGVIVALVTFQTGTYNSLQDLFVSTIFNLLFSYMIYLACHLFVPVHVGSYSYAE